MNKIKRLLSATLIMALMMATITPVYAQDTDKFFSSYDNEIYLGDVITPEDKVFLDKLTLLYEHVDLENNELVLKLEEKDLIDIYGFTSSDVAKINEVLNFGKNIENNLDENYSIQPNLHVENWKIWFTNRDVQDYLLAAAQIGPAAIILALQGIGSILPGAGNIVATIVGLIGAGTIIYYVTQAVALNRGMYIGIDWNGPFPNPAIGLW